MSWADKPNSNDMARRAGAARGDFDGDFAALRQRGRHLIAEIVRLSRQLTDLQQAIGARRGAPGRPRGSVSGGEPR
ncbi:hypothetical protein [Catellatospora citrea]|uniref:Uncharacterized protein n=1 Tax=Catellatospora citrea TaxID=53366 RepID=A0A8J3P3J2_9ACTN|nr:hypothetical protein [Catellatospora citrea]RKE02733.1 hypothetical protein C8E86_8042 [Catellatospora citrea]GIG02686.1 hypothetical protein Cci01nite_77790 [Catellatospora citrea]